MTAKSIHHINFLCRDLDASSSWMSKLLNQTPINGDLQGRGVQTARFNLGGVWLVLVQPDSEDSVVGQILEARGEGLFLLSLEVDDLAKSIDELEVSGITMSETGPRQGLDNWLVHDIDAPAAFGPILQLCQLQKNEP